MNKLVLIALAFFSVTTSFAQNIGIGTTTPADKLTVQTGVNGYGVTHTNGTVTVGTYISSGAGWLGTKSSHPLYLFTNNSGSQVTLNTAGNFGIGTNNPMAKLDVAGTIKIADGTQGTGKILTSDINGNAVWSSEGKVQPNTFVISDTKNDPTLLANNYTYKSSFNVNTQIASTINIPAETWISSSPFLKATNTPHVLNGDNNDFVVFGGNDGSKNLSNGAIYDAINDTWIAIPDMGDNQERSVPVVTWVNGKLFVWGGFHQKGFTQFFLNTGKIYDPTTKVWTSLPTLNAPLGRYIAAYGYNQATNEVAIWGGSGAGGVELGDGAKYNLNTNTWTTLPTLNAPAGRSYMGFSSGAGKLFIFGGILDAGGNAATAHFYDFAANTWTTLAAAGLPARYNAKTIFTGSSFLVWGGSGAGVGNEGAIYNLGSNTWSAMSTVSSPPATNLSTTTFSNGYFIYAGTDFNYKYSLLSNTWTPLTDFEIRGSNGIAGNANGIFIWGGKTSYDAAASVIERGARYFWTAQNITSNTIQPEEYYLYKKNL